MIISLREFRLKSTKYLGDLPVTLTIYGKPVAKVVSVNTNTDVLTEKKSVNRNVLTDKDKVLTENGSPTKSVNTNEPKVLTDISPKKEAFQELKKEFQYNPCPKPTGKPKKKKFEFGKSTNYIGICQAPECKKPAIEQVQISTLEGEDIMKRLCPFHAANAKKERGY